jgi:hypothetical protein
VRKRAKLTLVELMLLTASVGCTPHAKHEPSVAASATSLLVRALAPRAAGRFSCSDGTCRQEQPRLPDTGEWRCAEREQVVWCAGGEPAAGVVPGPADSRFRCGPRWGQAQERVCIDPHPDYPDGAENDYACSFDQERGIARACRRAEPRPPRPLAPARALSACWLDRDCPSGACDRGVCTCQIDAQCQIGRCQAGVCVEAAR